MNVDPQTVKTQQEDPFDRAGLAAEIAGQMQRKGEAELVGVAKYYRMAGLPAKKALETAALQAADVMTRYLTQGLVSATVEAMETGGDPGARTITVGPARPIRVTLATWRYSAEFVVRANGFEIACPRLDFRLEPRLEILDAGLRRWPDGGYELTLGRARFDCRVYLERPGGAVMIADPRTREVSIAEPISFGGSWTPGDEAPACPYADPSACPHRPRDGAPPRAG